MTCFEFFMRNPRTVQKWLHFPELQQQLWHIANDVWEEVSKEFWNVHICSQFMHSRVSQLNAWILNSVQINAFLGFFFFLVFVVHSHSGFTIN